MLSQLITNNGTGRPYYPIDQLIRVVGGVEVGRPGRSYRRSRSGQVPEPVSMEACLDTGLYSA